MIKKYFATDNFSYSIIIISIIIYCFSLADYLTRSPRDFLNSVEVCGKLEKLYYSSSRKSSDKLIAEVRHYKDKYRAKILNNREKAYQLLYPYQNKEICVRYVISPILKFLNYPIEFSSNDRLILPQSFLQSHYLNRNSYYISWFLIIGTTFVFFTFLKFRK